MTAFKGRFTSAMRWPQLDALWHVLHQQNDGGWFVYEYSRSFRRAARGDMVASFPWHLVVFRMVGAGNGGALLESNGRSKGHDYHEPGFIARRSS